MKLTYPLFYRRFGIRRITQLYNPPLLDATNLTLPRDSDYHWYNPHTKAYVPDVTEPLYQGYQKKIWVSHIDTLTSTLGNPKHLAKSPRLIFREWQLANTKRFRYVQHPEEIISDPFTLVLYNYGILYALYRYPKNLWASYYEWYNIEKTRWDHIAEVALKTRRQQFVIIDLPSVLPSLSLLNRFAGEDNSLRMLRVLSTYERIMLLELWRWVHPDWRSRSVMSAITPEVAPYVTVFYRYQSVACALNLGSLNEFNKEIDLSSLGIEVNGVRVKPSILQRFLLKLTLSLQNQDALLQAKEISAQSTEGEEELSAEVESDDEDEEGDTNELTRHDTEVEEEERSDELAERDDEIIPHSGIAQGFAPQLKKGRGASVKAPDLEAELTAYAERLDKDFELLEEANLPYLEEDEGAPEPSDSDSEEKEPSEPNAPTSTVKEVPQAPLTELAEKLTNPIDEDTREVLLYKPIDPLERVKRHVDSLLKNNLISIAQYRDTLKLFESSLKTPSGYDPNKTLKEYAQVPPEALHVESELPIREEVLPDPSYAHSTLKSFDRKYIKEVLPKDITACITKLLEANVAVLEHKVEVEKSALGNYELHAVKIKPIDGKESILHFRLPQISEEGEFYASGNKYRLRKQRGDVPIRKIDPDTVALSSYYGKVFVRRSARVQYDEYGWLANRIRSIGMSGGNDIIRKVILGNVFDNHIKAPYVYAALSEHFKSIITKDYELHFDHRERSQMLDEALLKPLENDRYYLVGRDTQGQAILVGFDNLFYRYEHNTYARLGSIYDLLGFSEEDAPIAFSELSLFNKAVPLGLVLGYYLGLSTLIRLLDVKVEVHPAQARVKPPKGYWVLRFSDVKLFIPRQHAKATLLLAGFTHYKDAIKNYPISQFDHKPVYYSVLETRGITSFYTRELDNLYDLFIDPMTASILEELHEPVTFTGLLERANELLTTRWHPDSSDMRYMRIKGYERIAGAVYAEIAKAVREYRAKALYGKSQISLAPYAVWNTITKDQAKKMSEDINPLNELKEMEAVTYVGVGGRAKEAMSASSRIYHPNDLGVISEGTVDSGDVAVNTFLSANPKLKNVRGLTEPVDAHELEGARIWSTIGMVSPGNLHDDPKRRLFAVVQHAHTVACEGYHQPYVRTGYEYVIPYRVGKLYAYMAQDDGEVIERSEHAIVVRYQNGEEVGVQLGRHYGRAEGSIYPHDIKSPLNLHDRFKKGDPIAYHSGFFEPDVLNPKQIILKTSLNAKVVFMDSTQTIEDASSISKRLSQKLRTHVIKELSYLVRFNQNVRKVLPQGTEVTPNDVLFIIEDEITSNLELFDEDTIESLARLAQYAPRAKVKGVIDRYEVYYNGELEDMSASLRKLASDSDKALRERTRYSDFPVQSGRVNEEYRVDGTPLDVDTAVIKVYIEVSDEARVGDKGVFANQMKSIFSEVMGYEVKTESGVEIDAIFSFKSINNRIVMSPLLIGTTTTLLEVIAKKAIALYEGVGA